MKWKILPKVSQQNQKKFAEVNPIVLQLLFNRQIITQQQIDEFLHPDYRQDIHDPFLLPEMRKAVNRIFKAITQQEKILIYGDYDVDGITSSTVIINILEALGHERSKMTVYLPDREKEGYGMSEVMLRQFAKKDFNLVITVDNGVNAKDIIDAVNDLKLDFIITDHHPLAPQRSLPKVFALIDSKLPEQKYPFPDLAGVGVAFKLAQALIEQAKKNKINPNKNWDVVEKWLLDLVALGTVADGMPLIGENRTLVHYGLIVLNKTARLGLRQLINCANLTFGQIGSSEIAYRLAPWINAAGRIHHASIAYQLLINQDEEKTRQLANQLKEANLERQKMVRRIVTKIKKEKGDLFKKHELIVVIEENIPIGILGLIAAELIREYHRPTLAISCRPENIKGSGRSMGGINVVKLLDRVKKYLITFGGHAQACGFTLKNKAVLNDFSKEIIAIADQELKKKSILSSELIIDSEIITEQINWELCEAVEKLAPFGQRNSVPRFLVRDVTIEAIKYVGKNKQHVQLIADGKKFIGFNFNKLLAESTDRQLSKGQHFDIVSEIGVNQWNGIREIELRIVDLQFQD